VDGNVYRVLARQYGIATPIDSTAGRREFQELANRLLDPQNPGEHNQAMMELGATVCTPRTPRCHECPIAAGCHARKEDQVAALPVKAGRTAVRTRHFNYLHVPHATGFHLRKRSGRDIWENLYELPLLETPKAASRKALEPELQALLPGARLQRHWGPVTHLLSHQRIVAVFWWVLPPAGAQPPAEWLPIPRERLQEFALPRLITRWLEDEPQAATV
jgi:A/G-specific adenine glycosylase